MRSRPGRGVTTRTAEAVAQLWGLTVARGNALAQYELSCPYIKGQGVLQDSVEAVRLLTINYKKEKVQKP